MSEEKRLIAIYALRENERMRTPYDDSFMDGYAEYSYGAVFNAAWKLAETVPTTDSWAYVLSLLYDRLQPDAFSVEKPLDVASRWLLQEEDEAKSVAKGFLSNHQGVRKCLAKLALAKSTSLAVSLLDSEDVAFRAAGYAHSDLTAGQIEKAYEKDGEFAFREMVHNCNIWRSSDKRKALHDVAWLVVNNDKHSDLMAANIFNGVRDNFAKDHPDWFKEDDDFVPEPSVEPATKADIKELASLIAAPAVALPHIKGMLDIINRRLGFVWWFSLGACVGTFSRYF